MQPYRQGEIDFFCAIYAIINSARVACTRIRRLNFSESCEFYQHLMQHLYDRGEFINVLYHGTEYKLMDELLDAADKYLQNKYNIRLLYTHPFQYRDLSLSRAFLFIKKYLSGPGTSCIIRLDNRIVFDHWSVLNKTDNKFFGLFDSYGYSGMDFKKSIWNSGTTVADKNATLISKQGIILIKCIQI